MGRAGTRGGSGKRRRRAPPSSALPRGDPRQPPRRVREGLGVSGRDRAVGAEDRGRRGGDSARRDARRRHRQPDLGDRAGSLPDRRGAGGAGQRLREAGHDGPAGKSGAGALREVVCRRERARGPSAPAIRRRLLGGDSPECGRRQGVPGALDPALAGAAAGGLRRHSRGDRARERERREAGGHRGRRGPGGRHPARRSAADLSLAADGPAHRGHGEVGGGHGGRHRALPHRLAVDGPRRSRAQPALGEGALAGGPDRVPDLARRLGDRAGPPGRGARRRARPAARGPRGDPPRAPPAGGSGRDAQEEQLLRRLPRRERRRIEPGAPARPRGSSADPGPRLGNPRGPRDPGDRPDPSRHPGARRGAAARFASAGAGRRDGPRIRPVSSRSGCARPSTPSCSISTRR